MVKVMYLDDNSEDLNMYSQVLKEFAAEHALPNDKHLEVNICQVISGEPQINLETIKDQDILVLDQDWDASSRTGAWPSGTEFAKSLRAEGFTKPIIIFTRGGANNPSIRRDALAQLQLGCVNKTQVRGRPEEKLYKKIQEACNMTIQQKNDGISM